jgi:hypothetical protein
MRTNNKNAGETLPMGWIDSDDAEPLPVDGMDVEEFRDADTVRLFMLEWRRRVARELPDAPAVVRRMPLSDGMMGA